MSNRFNQAYEDCSDPYIGALINKPSKWSQAEWNDYCDGVDAFNDDTRALKGDTT